jgi:glucosamine-6-phosphate isomerase
MHLQVFSDYEAMSKHTAEVIIEIVNQKPDAYVCVASGDTPLGTCKALVQAHTEGRVDFSKATFVGLDEWVGMDQNDEGSCKYFVYKNLFEPLGLSDNQILYFDAKATDLEAECLRVNQQIAAHGGLDTMVVGMGMNGHIALNEPGTSFDSYAHVSDLDPITVSVGQKYFSKETPLTQGITLGLRHLSEAGKAILIVNGGRKASILRKALLEPVTEQVPASIFQAIPDSYGFVDQEAASEIV